MADNKFLSEPEVAEQLEDEVQVKKYVIIDTLKSTAQIFLGDKDSDKAFRLDTPRRVGLYLRHTFADKKGTRKTSRLKLGSNSIWQTDQIVKDMIPANERFTDEERKAVFLINGVLVTSDQYIQAFLHEDNNPQRAEFTGRDRGGVTPVIMEMDDVALAKAENTFVRNTAKALTRIFEMEMDEVSALISLFYGSSFTIPTSLVDAQNLAAKALEGSEAKIKIVLDANFNKDDEITVLLSKAINQGVLTFEMKPDYVQIRKNNQWIDAKLVVGDSYEQREILFKQYLASEEGELLRKDLEAITSLSVTKNSNKKR